jgi:hypothetical protein
MNPNSDSSINEMSTDCCICLNSMAPYQALFLAPCSHSFHYKCLLPLLSSGNMFQCPLCRQVSNLEASVVCEDDLSDIPIDSDTGMEHTLNGIQIANQDECNFHEPFSPNTFTFQPHILTNSHEQEEQNEELSQILTQLKITVQRLSQQNVSTDALLSQIRTCLRDLANS